MANCQRQRPCQSHRTPRQCHRRHQGSRHDPGSSICIWTIRASSRRTVILDVEKHRHFAEIILHCTNHITIEASHETDDMYASIDGVAAKIAQQMRKYKTKILRNHRPPSIDPALRCASARARPHVSRDRGVGGLSSSRRSANPVKPMYIDEAVLQIEMSNRQFVVFLNAKTEKVNILYRRKRRRLRLDRTDVLTALLCGSGGL